MNPIFSFNITEWLDETNSIKLQVSDRMVLAARIKNGRESNKIKSGSLLDYFVNYKNFNVKQESETKKQFVARLLKKDFERSHDISFDEFMDVCRDIHENEPESLI